MCENRYNFYTVDKYNHPQKVHVSKNRQGYK